MPGYNQQQLLYKVHNSNACSIVIGDVIVGFGQTMAPSMDFGTEGLYGIGSAKPQEIQQLRFSNTITLDRYRLTAEGQAYFGESEAMWTLLANNSFNFYLLDETGASFLAYVGAVAQSNNVSVNANTPITEGMSFLALDVLDANGVSVLNSNSSANFNPLASSVAVPLVAPGG